MAPESSLVFTDTLPDHVNTDLSLASTFIPPELLEGIAQLITRIDMSIYGIDSRFDALSATISHSSDFELNGTFSSINSAANTQDFSPISDAGFI
jgi:hypothetical protein